ncbi:hypothetical protein [Magnetospirillum sp. 64-120]|uniref:hypothetical protein n=1 Tax=Magnetospirillum sp. 64-120 TaxID=1895778 RepID=UPI0025C01489|nr:hypothetical protein [Magnetospirillum sp. 64-120]
MLRIEEIVGAMDDEFRYSLEALSDERLAQLMADKAALRRLRPVGVSTAEAQAMIAAIQDKRAHPPAKPAAKPRKPRPPRKPKAVPPAEAPPLAAEPVPPLALPIRPEPPRLPTPIPQGPAIRLGPPPSSATTIILGPPAPPPIAEPTAPEPAEIRRSEGRRHALVLALVILVSGFFLLQYGG